MSSLHYFRRFSSLLLKYKNSFALRGRACSIWVGASPVMALCFELSFCSEGQRSMLFGVLLARGRGPIGSRGKGGCHFARDAGLKSVNTERAWIGIFS